MPQCRSSLSQLHTEPWYRDLQPYSKPLSKLWECDDIRFLSCHWSVNWQSCFIFPLSDIQKRHRQPTIWIVYRRMLSIVVESSSPPSRSSATEHRKQERYLILPKKMCFRNFERFGDSDDLDWSPLGEILLGSPGDICKEFSSTFSMRVE